MANPDVSALTTAFIEQGGPIFGKAVLNWKLRQQGIQVRTNVNTPQALTKLSAVGGPRPYSAGDNTSGNGVKYTNRTLTAYMAKWDHDFDPQEFRNTFLAGVANAGAANMAQAATEQLAKEFLASIINNVLLTGVRNGAGTTAADIADGWGTIIAALITATTVTPVATGAITSANAVTKVDQLVSDGFTPVMREWDTTPIIFCSYDVFDKYIAHYRTLNGYKLQTEVNGDYKLDGKNAILRPVGFMKQSQRLIGTVDQNLVFGTDVESIQVAASMRRNIIESRPMMAVGCEFQDLDLLVVNDQA